MHLFCSAFFLIFVLVDSKNSDTVEKLENIIKKGIQNAMNFEFPTNARQFAAPEEPVKNYGSYDFVIIGGGAAGSVLANRLTQIPHFNILVLEAGNFTNNGFEQFVHYSIPFQVNSDLNWGYMTIPQTSSCLAVWLLQPTDLPVAVDPLLLTLNRYLNESCMVPRGRGVGGSTLINACIYSRGNPDNYDQWATITNDSSWSFKNVLKYFIKSEHFHWTDPKAPVDIRYHGRNGPIQVQQRIPHVHWSDDFMEANKKFGFYPIDYNSPQQIGTSIFQLTTINGKREDMGSVFLRPILNNRNLTVLTGSYVTKIEINPSTKETQSVLFTKNGTTYRVKAIKEVLLSAGTIASPQILMLSGIGPEKHLKELGIEAIQNLGVGSRFHDQPSVILRISSNFKLEEESLDSQVKEYLNGRGLLTAFPLPQAMGFYRFNGTKIDVPNLEIISDILQKSVGEIKLERYKRDVYNALWGNNGSHISFVINNIAPKSFGTIRLKKRSPFEYPLIDSRLLTDPVNEDIEALYKGIEYVFKLIHTEPYKKYELQYLAEPLPPCRHLKFKSKEYWYCYIRQVTQTFYHPVGSCRMGSRKETGAVVDSNLKVFGVKKLRVVDASVVPSTVSGHSAMAVMTLAEKISDVIKLQYC